MEKNKFYAGIDVGGTKIAGILATARGKIINRVKSPTPKDASPGKITRIISGLLEEMLYASGLRKKDLLTAGIGIPGVVDTKTGRIIRTPNMKISGSSFRNILEKKLKIKCLLGNDANLGMLGERWLGAARNTQNAVGIFIGTGIGAGIIANGALISGSHGAAAELGHMIIRDDGPKCSCGNIGCLEALAGRWAIERDIKQAAKRGEKTIITKLLDKKTDTLKSKILRKALKNHDNLTLEIVTAAAQQLGIACVSIRHIFDPEMIVLGGGVIEACGDFIIPIVKKKVEKDRFFSDIGECSIAPSELGDDAVVLGAVALAKTQL
ncbi:MAG: ROK family protein [Candidatus Omnitrophica bacterium]|jgi:glucokinase|nr:ROK family protein [Candidatus Omnitrophota bacterium]MDD5078605.1 ROK family protein [Candidatus Omnitrophota bacterium]MDD5725620.1 ROK family protein [Candidatus Omnitrophota bacterium]